MIEQNVIIKLIDEFSNNLGTLTISAIDYLSKDLPTFRLYDGITLKNVPVLDHLDVTTPIIYYDNLSSHIPKLMLLEETEYHILFESDDSNDDFDILYSLVKINNNHFNKLRFSLGDENSYKSAGTLNFRSYVGKSFLDVRKNGVNSIQIPIEVRSKKIDYINQYSAMISDLSQQSLGLIFDIGSPLFQEFKIDYHTEKETYYEYFMFLEFIFREENLPSIFEYLSKNLHSQLKNDVEFVPLYLASNLNHNVIVNIVSKPNNLFKSKIDYPMVTKLQGYLPQEIVQIKHDDVIDTPENRFFKYFLESIRDLIDKLLLNSKNGYVKDKLLDFKDEIEYYLSNKFFNHISSINYIPFNSQILQKKEGYREIFEYFLMLEFSFMFSWEEMDDQFKGFEKKLSELYEYWCYFKLLKVLNELSIDDINFKDIFKIDNNNNYWSIKIKRGEKSSNKFKIMIGDVEVVVELFYNLNFFKDSKRNNISYSLIFKPDFTLKIHIGGYTHHIHFDAKYRSELDIADQDINDLEGVDKRDEQEELNSIFKNGDIYKMHTYKDSILKSHGAYILYPGNTPHTFKVSDSQEIPSVGAFSLTPGKNENGEEELSKFIMEILKILSLNKGVYIYEWYSSNYQHL